MVSIMTNDLEATPSIRQANYILYVHMTTAKSGSAKCMDHTTYPMVTNARCWIDVFFDDVEFPLPV